MNIPDSPRILALIAMCIMLSIFVAYMIFLVYTWQQLQRDRSSAMAKINDVLDRMPAKVQPDAPNTG